MWELNLEARASYNECSLNCIMQQASADEFMMVRAGATLLTSRQVLCSSPSKASNTEAGIIQNLCWKPLWERKNHLLSLLYLVLPLITSWRLHRVPVGSADAYLVSSNTARNRAAAEWAEVCELWGHGSSLIIFVIIPFLAVYSSLLQPLEYLLSKLRAFL